MSETGLHQRVLGGQHHLALAVKVGFVFGIVIGIAVLIVAFYGGFVPPTMNPLGLVIRVMMLVPMVTGTLAGLYVSILNLVNDRFAEEPATASKPAPRGSVETPTDAEPIHRRATGRTVRDERGRPTIAVPDIYRERKSQIDQYDAARLGVGLVPGDPEVGYDEARMVVVVRDFFDGEELGVFESNPFSRSDAPLTVAVDIDLKGVLGHATHQVLQYVARIRPRNPADGEVATLMETDPFVYLPDQRRLIRVQPESELPDTQGSSSRTSIEGAYRLDYAGRTASQDWRVSLSIPKSEYGQAIARSRGRTRSQYVQYELSTGHAAWLAGTLAVEADRLGFTDRLDRLQFVIDFVQSFQYVSDGVSKGYDDYTKFIVETLVELGGDCEDTALLLAAVLSADPLGYDAIVIEPPGHTAAGIHLEDADGQYYENEGKRYYYVETTGPGWAIGDVPEIHRDQEATLHPV